MQSSLEVFKRSVVVNFSITPASSQVTTISQYGRQETSWQYVKRVVQNDISHQNVYDYYQWRRHKFSRDACECLRCNYISVLTIDSIREALPKRPQRGSIVSLASLCPHLLLHGWSNGSLVKGPNRSLLISLHLRRILRPDRQRPEKNRLPKSSTA